jgi:hypothetical protein
LLGCYIPAREALAKAALRPISYSVRRKRPDRSRPTAVICVPLPRPTKSYINDDGGRMTPFRLASRNQIPNSPAPTGPGAVCVRGTRHGRSRRGRGKVQHPEQRAAHSRAGQPDRYRQYDGRAAQVSKRQPQGASLNLLQEPTSQPPYDGFAPISVDQAARLTLQKRPRNELRLKWVCEARIPCPSLARRQQGALHLTCVNARISWERAQQLEGSRRF